MYTVNTGYQLDHRPNLDLDLGGFANLLDTLWCGYLRFATRLEIAHAGFTSLDVPVDSQHHHQ